MKTALFKAKPAWAQGCIPVSLSILEPEAGGLSLRPV